jgi:hypothetical protein
VANLRSQVSKVVFSGTIGLGDDPAEIWSTGFWVAGYGGAGDLSDFDPASYIVNQAQPMMVDYAAIMSSAFTCTMIKCNVFGITAGKVKQVTDPTVDAVVDIVGSGPPYQATNVTAQGWRLQNSTVSRGNATSGRMFWPPCTAAAGSSGNFDGNGHWLPAAVSAVSATLSPAWDNLKVEDGTNTGVTYLPSVVTSPTVKNGLAEFSVNSADVTTAESLVWVLRSRKNALVTGGTRTTHPSFS